MAQGKKTNIEEMKRIVRYKNENPKLSNEEVGRLCGVSGSHVGTIIFVEKMVREKDTNAIDSMAKKIAVKSMAEAWCKEYGVPMTLWYPDQSGEIPQTESTESQNEGVYLFKVLDAMTAMTTMLANLTAEVKALRSDMNANFDNQYKMLDNCRQKIDKRK